MYLTKVTETYRITSEKEVESFLAELKKDKRFTIAKYTSTKKQKKQKGEVVDEWIRFEVTKIFNEEDCPNSEINIDYTVKSIFEGGFNVD